jgi:hypothetical protein
MVPDFVEPHILTINISSHGRRTDPEQNPYLVGKFFMNMKHVTMT